MKIIEIIAQLRGKGITLANVAGKLAVDGPDGIFTPELLDTLQRNKSALLLALQANPNGPRLLGVVEAAQWETRHNYTARSMIRAATSDPQQADKYFRKFSGEWTTQLCIFDATEESAVKHAFDVLRESLRPATRRAAA